MKPPKNAVVRCQAGRAIVATVLDYLKVTDVEIEKRTGDWSGTVRFEPDERTVDASVDFAATAACVILAGPIAEQPLFGREKLIELLGDVDSVFLDNAVHWADKNRNRNELVDELIERTRHVLSENVDALDRLTRSLLRMLRLTGEEVQEIVLRIPA